MLVENIISERYINAIGDSERSMNIKQRYLDQVWDILQRSYAPIGGIKGSGFENKEAMLSLPMWKMGIRDGRVRAVIIYKDKGGRKSVAMGTDGSQEGMWFVENILGNEITRSYGEKSKGALGKILKTVPWNILKNYVVPVKDVMRISDDKITPITSVPESDWPNDAHVTIDRYPHIAAYGYLRELSPGNEMFKVMIGSPGKTIR